MSWVVNADAGAAAEMSEVPPRVAVADVVRVKTGGDADGARLGAVAAAGLRNDCANTAVKSSSSAKHERATLNRELCGRCGCQPVAVVAALTSIRYVWTVTPAAAAMTGVEGTTKPAAAAPRSCS